MIETDASGNVVERQTGGTMQTISASVDVNFVHATSKSSGSAAGDFDFRKDGFVFFDDPGHYSDCAEVIEFATRVNRDDETGFGDIAKMRDGAKYARAFQRKASDLMTRHDPTLKDYIL